MNYLVSSCIHVCAHEEYGRSIVVINCNRATDARETYNRMELKKCYFLQRRTWLVTKINLLNVIRELTLSCYCVSSNMFVSDSLLESYVI